MNTIQLLDQIKSKSFTWYNNANGIILRDFNGFEYAQTNNSFQDLPSRLGAYFSASKFSTRRLSWGGDLVGDSIFTNRRLMLAPMSQDGIKLLKFNTYDGLDLQCEVAIDKLVFPYTHSIHTFLVEAIAADWRFYSQTLKSFTFGETILEGGFTIPTSIPVDLDGDMEVDNVMTNDGDEDTFPIITITGPGNTFVVGNGANNKSFTLNIELDVGEEVVIDTKNSTVMMGSENLFDVFDGDFMTLESGDNVIAFSATTGSSPDTAITFEYRDAYRGV